MKRRAGWRVADPSDRRQTMKRTLAVLALVAAIAPAATQAKEMKGGMQEVVVGGQAMYPTKDIVDNAVNSADHTTLVAAVKAADLVATLKGPGPFTVFAPTNDAFRHLPAGTVEKLLEPGNKAALTRVLTYHVVAGRLGSEQLRRMIKAGGGAAELKTVSGGRLWAMLNGESNIVIKD